MPQDSRRFGEMTMTKMAHMALAAAMLASAMPATADVKTGVDAWARGDYAAAIAEWRSPAAAGDADAQFNLGQAYKLGRGVPIDQPAATEWFRKAAMQGHAQASDNYGLALFQDGRKADALPWLEKSVARDEKRAELVLGTMLFNGDAVTKDWTRAYALVTRSSQQGLPQASQTLAQMDGYIPEAQRMQGLAMARRVADDARVASRAPLPKTIRSTPLPASTAPTTDYAEATPPPAAQPNRTTPPKARPAPAAKPPVVAAVPRAATSGDWSIQLGAFRDEGNAHRLWTQVGAKTGGSPAFVRAAGLTKLQATGFASRADAQRACTRAASACVVVAR